MDKLMTEYDFTIKVDDFGFTVVLTELSTNKTKEFYQTRSTLAGLTSHMNSLTDDLCSSWFNQRERKKPKKQV